MGVKKSWFFFLVWLLLFQGFRLRVQACRLSGALVLGLRLLGSGCRAYA